MSLANPYTIVLPDDTTAEAAEVLLTFCTMLLAVTGDGGKKRAAGLKPHWTVDQSHEAAVFSHLSKWKHGEEADPDSGAHPLIHLAWRALAIAWQERIARDIALEAIEAEETYRERHPEETS